jgi:NADH-quinone oxidoreductase subunit G
MPGLLPGGRALAEAGSVAGVWSRLPDAQGLDAHAMLQAAADGQLRALYLIGVDPVRDFADPALARAALEAVDTVIVQDLLETETTPFADVVLPAAAPQERVGSFTTWEGRRQPFGQVVPPPQLCLEDWDILRQVSRAMNRDLGWETAMDIRREAAPLMAADESVRTRLARITAEAPQAPPPTDDDQLVVEAVPPLLGRGSMLRGADALNATARAPQAWVHPDDAERAGLSEGDRASVSGPNGRIDLPVHVTDQVAAGCVRLPVNATDDPLGALIDSDAGRGAPLRVRLAAAAREAAGA